ncbi:hypothetical protein SI65_03706 [Aspergillus cristatus]|uniref:Uncharacterized protein n=1 Tax=Aspergillus cristatus TaxID=573508 RepID=A0A1E3BI59_ASPCR|nr:hypothetical protein SI65_03706 [Aspergillus cristatus]
MCANPDGNTKSLKNGLTNASEITAARVKSSNLFTLRKSPLSKPFTHIKRAQTKRLRPPRDLSPTAPSQIWEATHLRSWLSRLVELLVDALIEWPSSRTPDLIALLTAISKTPDNLHRGEALNYDDELLTWDGVPYINMVWRDANWMTPHIIVKECSKSDDFETSKQQLVITTSKHKTLKHNSWQRG